MAPEIVALGVDLAGLPEDAFIPEAPFTAFSQISHYDIFEEEPDEECRCYDGHEPRV